MPHHLAHRFRRPYPARPRGTVFSALLAILLAAPTLAMAAHGSPGKPQKRLPYCGGFPAGSIASLARTSEIKLSEARYAPPEEDVCAWKTPRAPGHYADLLQAALYKIPRAAFAQGEQDAKRNAAADNAVFSTVEIPGAAAAYRVVTVTDSKALAPCAPGTVLDEFGPPQCNGDPPWETVVVDAFGAFKPHGPTVAVSFSVSGEPSVFLQGPSLVIEKILSIRIP